MKGIIRKIKESDNDFIVSDAQQGSWKVEYEKLLPHAGISKKGTGPGVGKKIYITKSIPLHSKDISMVTENMEVEFEIDGSFAILKS